MPNIHVIAIRVHRMKSIIAHALEIYNYIGNTVHQKLLEEHRPLQKELKNSLETLREQINTVESYIERHNKMSNVYLPSFVSNYWDEAYKGTKKKLEAIQLIVTTLSGTCSLPYHQQQLLKAITQDILQCFTSSSDYTEQELKNQLQQNEFQNWLKKNCPRFENCSCFISYAWGNYALAKRVYKLAEHLKLVNVNVKLDIWDNRTNSVAAFIAQIQSVDFILVIGSTELTEKWDNYTTAGKSRNQTEEDYKGNVVAQELEQISTRKIQRPVNKHGILCLPFEGEFTKVFPEFLTGLAADCLDFKNPDHYFMHFLSLLIELNKPKENELRKAYESFKKDCQLLNDLSGEKLLQANGLTPMQNGFLEKVSPISEQAALRQEQNDERINLIKLYMTSNKPPLVDFFKSKNLNKTIDGKDYADCQNIQLPSFNLTKANFSYSDLTKGNLTNTKLNEVKFCEAILNEAIITNATGVRSIQLSQAKYTILFAEDKKNQDKATRGKILREQRLEKEYKEKRVNLQKFFIQFHQIFESKNTNKVSSDNIQELDKSTIEELYEIIPNNLEKTIEQVILKNKI